MAIWTDVIDPATLTGYARASLAEYEAKKGTLAQWLPNRTVTDTVIKLVQGDAGLVDVAKFRAYDAEPEIGRRRAGRRVTLELPALGQNIPVSEYQQLRTRNASDTAVLNAIQTTTDTVVRAVADSIERMRGIVLATGKATINQDNFRTDDDFGRRPENTVTAEALWNTPDVSRMADLQAWHDTYVDATGEQPGAIVLSQKAFRALAGGNEFRTVLNGGGARLGTRAEIQALLDSEGMAQIVTYDRRVSVDGVATRVLPENTVLMLPAAGPTTNESGSPLGSTIWGQTLTATAPEWAIEDVEQPGLVTGVWRNPKPPMIAEVIADAIALPVLANANLSLAAKVL
ncbi:major capsid protein [Kocuria sp. MNB10]